MPPLPCNIVFVNILVQSCAGRTQASADIKVKTRAPGAVGMNIWCMKYWVSWLMQIVCHVYIFLLFSYLFSLYSPFLSLKFSLLCLYCQCLYFWVSIRFFIKKTLYKAENTGVLKKIWRNIPHIFSHKLPAPVVLELLLLVLKMMKLSHQKAE